LEMLKISVFPHATPEKPGFAKTAERREISFTELHDLACNTAWSPALVKDNRRSSDNFEQCQVIALDFDGELSLVDTMTRLEEEKLSYSLTFSKSHQIEKNGTIADRFRVIIPLEKTIKTGATFLATWKKLHSIFPEIDAQCKDAARFFFASKAPHKLVIDGAPFPVFTQEETAPIKNASVTHSKSSTEKAQIGPGVLFFLRNCHTGIPGGFNTALMVAAKECARGNMNKVDALNLLEAQCPQPFDEKDKGAFESGWKKGLKEGILPSLRKINKKDLADEMLQFIIDCFEEKYKVLNTDENSRGRILSLDPNNIVHTANVMEIRAEVASLINSEFHMAIGSDQIKSLVDTWILHADIHDIDPKPVAFKEDESLTFHRLDFEPEKGEFPVIQEFLDRVHNAEALMAYTWSLLESKSYNQQYLWMTGPGGEGKSSYTEFLSMILKDAYVSSSSQSVADKHFTSTIVGKRLVSFSDTNNPKFTTSGNMKAITGGDKVSVRPLYANAYSVKLDTKVFVCSNYMPEIPNTPADTRRLILCTVEPLKDGTVMDTNYVDKLWAERKAFLWACKEAYERLAPNHGPIDCDLNILEEAVQATEWRQQVVLDKHFTFEDDDAILSIDEIMQPIHYDIKPYGLRQRDIEQYLKNTKGLKKSRKRNNGSRVYGYKGIKLK